MGKECKEELQERRGKGNIGTSFKSKGNREYCKGSGQQLWRKWGQKKIGVVFLMGITIDFTLIGNSQVERERIQEREEREE